MDESLSEIEKTYGKPIDEFVKEELGYGTVEELHNALAAEQVDSVAMAIHQMKQGQAMIIGDQTGVGKGRQMAALIRWAHRQGKKPIFITKDANLFTDIYRDMVDVGSGDLRPFIFNKYVKSGKNKDKSGEMVDTDGNLVYKGASDAEWKKVLAGGKLPDEYDYAVLTYSQVDTGDKQSREEARDAAKSNGGRGNSKKKDEEARISPKAPFLRQIAKDNYLLLDESHTAAGESNTGAYLQSLVRDAKGVTFASATFAKRTDTMPLYAIRTAMSKANVKANELIGIIKKGGVTLQEIMSRALTKAGQMVRRERDMSDVQTDWETISDPATVKRARENYDKTIEAFNAIIRFQELYIKPLISQLDSELAEVASTANVKKGTNKMGVENTPFASKTYNYTKQLMLALKVDAIVDKVIAEIKAGRHPVIALESTMEASISDYSPGDIISEPTFSANLLRGLETVMQYTVTDAEGKDTHRRYLPSDLGLEGEKAYYELQDFIRESTSDIFISPLDAIIERLKQEGYKVGELTGRNQYVERNDEGEVVVKQRTDKDKKRMQREFNNGELDVLILNKSASTGISLHASARKDFKDKRQRTMIIAQPLSDINDYMQMIGRIDRTGQVHRGYYINLGLPVPAENRFLMMLATKLKSLNANTTTSQESENNSVEAPDLLNKYGSQVVVEYLRDNPEIYVKMGEPIKEVTVNQLDDYTPPENDEVVRRITGYVALLSTKEQEEFYNDVVRRYNDLIKYLDDTGQNDLKITVMPLRAKTIERRVSSQGVDPNGTNPFAKDAFVETVEIDVLRKPMKADEVRKTIESLNTPKGTEKGHFPTAAADNTFGDRVLEILGIVQRETQAKLRDEEERYEESKKIALEDIAKKSDKIRAQQKLNAEEKEQAIADYVAERNAEVERQHERAVARIQEAERNMQSRLGMFVAGSSYLMPDQLNDAQLSSPELASPAIFLGYKAKESKVTPSTTFAVFATLDGRRRIELKLSDAALFTIRNMSRENYDLANRVTLENWDSELPTSTRKNAFILTGNILQAVAATQDQNGNYPGQLISYTDENGDVHDGILMPDKWKPTMMKNSGVPINARLSQIEQGKAVASTDGKVTITKSRWSGSWLLTVPKSKKEGAVYFENPVILKVVGGFWQSRGQFAADINSVEDLRTVVKELANIGVKVSGEQNGGVELSVSNNNRSSIENTESKRIAFEAATTALARAGYEVVRATEKDIENLKKDNKLLRKLNGTINGWLGKDGRIYLTDTGMNAETAVHEYTHLWAEALEMSDPELWNEIKKLLKGTRTWNEVKNNPAYAEYDEDRLAEEVLAHLSGRDNGARMEAEAKRMIDEADTMADAAKAASMLNRLKEALKKFWTWVGKNLFGIKGKIDLDTVENMILADLVNGVNLFGPSGGRKKNTTEQSFTPTLAENEIAEEVNRKTGATKEAVSWVVRKGKEFWRNWTDYARPIQQMQEVISKAIGRKLRDSEDVFNAIYRMPNVVKSVYGNMEKIFMRPLKNAIGRVIEDLGSDFDSAYDAVSRYMIAKHGLERNEWFYQQELAEFEELKKDTSWMAAQQAMYDALPEKRKASMTFEEYIDSKKPKKKDKAGLSGLAQLLGMEAKDFTKVAERVVSDFENEVDADNINGLWQSVNAITDALLDMEYESGLTDKAHRDELKAGGRWKYYVPLRGFNSNTSGDYFDYDEDLGMYANPIKSAKGRKSMSADPMGQIAELMQQVILASEKNKVGTKFYNLTVNSRSDLLRLRDVWMEKSITGEWREVSPDIPEGTTPAQVAEILKQFDADMRKRKAEGEKVKKGTNKLDLSVDSSIDGDTKVLPYNKKKHEVLVYVNGKPKVIYVNGNPEIARVMNEGARKVNADWLKPFFFLTRLKAQLNTTFSPLFPFRNTPRDMQFLLRNAFIMDGAKGWLVANRNMARALRAVPRLIATEYWSKNNTAKLGKLLHSVKVTDIDGNVVETLKGKDAAERILQWWNEFLDNGGETGMIKTLSAEQYEKDLRESIKKLMDGGREDGESVLNKLTLGGLEQISRISEDISRFAAYTAYRSTGHSIHQSATFANNATLNFQKKGGGKAAAVFRGLFPFLNARIRGLAQMFEIARDGDIKQRVRFGSVLAMDVAKGYIVSQLTALLLSLFGGDDDDDENGRADVWDAYEFLSQYKGNNNLILYLPWTKKFATIPMPQEYAPFLAIGNIAFREQMGWNYSQSMAGQIVDMFLGQSPIEISEGGTAGGRLVRTLWPGGTKEIAEVIFNENFMGNQIWYDTPYNQSDANWTKAKDSTPKFLVDLSKWLNGGYVKPKNEFWDRFNNPALWWHLMKGADGGLGRTGEYLFKTVEKVANDESFGIEDIPGLRAWFIGSEPDDYKYGIINAYQSYANDFYKNAFERYGDYKKMDSDMKERVEWYSSLDYDICDIIRRNKEGLTIDGNRVLSKGASIDDMLKEMRNLKAKDNRSEEDEAKIKQLESSIRSAEYACVEECNLAIMANQYLPKTQRKKVIQSDLKKHVPSFGKRIYENTHKAMGDWDYIKSELDRRMGNEAGQ